MSVRAKFRVNHIERAGDGQTIQLHPVYSGSPENEAFFKATPGGQISLYCVNPEANEQFALGKEFYIDFTPAS
jgi:hypothetical protein